MSRSKTDHLQFGKTMEERGALWLLESRPSLRLISRNYRWKGGELDLIFEETTRNGLLELVIVEVRARSTGAWVDPVSSVSFPKQMRLSRTIRRFLTDYRGPAKSLRLDILAWDGSAWCHIHNVRLPDN